ncbi:MAG TPA: MarR family transcriptional regulator [Xanthomonadaceae bacterium]|nr:MarR family transcriptional regulator [Xanthomonadaceae bacterium]
MGSFDPTEQRVEVTCRRQPAFPREPAILVRLVKHLYKRIHTNANGLLRPYGIGHAEYDILMMLYGTPEQALTPSEVAESAGEKMANVTRLTDQLCEKGLVRRSASTEDRRKVVLTLDASGEALIDRMLPDICVLLAQEVSGLSDAEQLRLEALLKKMLEGMESAG